MMDKKTFSGIEPDRFYSVRTRLKKVVRTAKDQNKGLVSGAIVMVLNICARGLSSVLRLKPLIY